MAGIKRLDLDPDSSDHGPGGDLRIIRLRGPWLSAAIDINAQHEPLRGGSWHNHAQNLRSAYRNSNDADNRDDNIGFRVAAPPPNTLLCCREHRAGVSFAGTTLQGWLG